MICVNLVVNISDLSATVLHNYGLTLELLNIPTKYFITVHVQIENRTFANFSPWITIDY